MQKKVYISGQISGLPITQAELNFQRAEDLLIAAGYTPVNPMKLEHNHARTWEMFMREDIAAMMTCDYIFMLDNWANSRGATIELELAEKIGIKPIYQFDAKAD